jgi:uncharacterized protein with ParB-like and HNH nuclease domain
MALYTDDTIHRIVDGVNQKYFLPDIQRPFVWKQDQIYALFDSIMRGYPINTFLFWEVSKKYLQENQIKRFKFLEDNKGDNVEETTFSDRDSFLVLDGQQRITTLNIALKGHYLERRKKKELFMNVLSGKEENDDSLLYEFKFLGKIGDLFFQENGKIWVNVKRVYECKDDEQKRGLRNEIKKLNPESENLIEGNIDKLHSRLRSEELLNYYTERENDYDKVLDIFVRTNSGGTKLTYSDLLFSTIKLRWRDARDNFTDLLNEINGGIFDFDTDFILKTCFVLFAETQQDVKYSKKNVDDQNKIDNIVNNWKKITDSIKITRDLLTKFGIIHSKLLTSNNALIPLTYFIYKKDLKGFGESGQKKIISPENGKIMKSFLLSSLITGLFGGQSDTILYSIKKEIDSSTSPYFPLGQIKFALTKRNKELNITEDFLDNVYYKDRNSYLILNLIYPDTNFNVNAKSNLPEQDHIFSRSELKQAGYKEDQINSLYNIRYLTSIANKKKSNILFKEWVETITLEERKTHLIPDGEWSIENYKEFLEKRKNLFLEKMKEAISFSFDQKVL